MVYICGGRVIVENLGGLSTPPPKPNLSSTYECKSAYMYSVHHTCCCFITCVYLFTVYLQHTEISRNKGAENLEMPERCNYFSNVYTQTVTTF